MPRRLLIAVLAGLASGLVAAGCYGPPAPDVAICRDIITRLCIGPVCTSTQAALNVPEDGCETELLARTGCGSEEFAFTTPERPRVLQCRKPLIRVSASTYVKAPCPDVDEMFATCPDMTAFLNGVKP
ncbi:MAG: hypothetical protein AMXMBFR34_22620 [Myxococcaceae bacterium]